MIVRNLETEEVRRRWYVAHGGGMATMLFDATELQGILFMAHAVLKPNRVLERVTYHGNIRNTPQTGYPKSPVGQ